MKNKNEQLIMLMIHLLQVEAWSETIMSDPSCLQKFKFLLKDVKNSSSLLNKYMQNWLDEDFYEISAEVSDSILKMIKLPEDKLIELTTYINNYVEKNCE